MGKLALQAENLLMLRNEKPFIVNRKINAWFNVNGNVSMFIRAIP